MAGKEEVKGREEREKRGGEEDCLDLPDESQGTAEGLSPTGSPESGGLA